MASQLEQFGEYYPDLEPKLVNDLVGFAETVRAIEGEDVNAGMLHLSHHALSEMLRCLHLFPDERALSAVQRFYP